MSKKIDDNIINYFQEIENNISALPLNERESIYRSCAINCVKDSVLAEQRRQYEECNGDMDLIYTKYPNSEFYFRRIIEPGHIYEMGYPKCLCHLYETGLLKNAGHCECSRQSIIYILHELAPNRKISVEIIDTVLSGAKECTFRITVE